MKVKSAVAHQESSFTRGRLMFYVLSLFVFFLAIRFVGELKDIRQLLSEMSPIWLLFAVAGQLLTYIFNVMILRTLLKREGSHVGFFTLFKLSVVIIFVNQALPSGGISGNGYILGQLVKRGVPAHRAFSCLIIETICYYAAFLLLLGTF